MIGLGCTLRIVVVISVDDGVVAQPEQDAREQVDDAVNHRNNDWQRPWQDGSGQLDNQKHLQPPITRLFHIRAKFVPVGQIKSTGSLREMHIQWVSRPTIIIIVVVVIIIIIIIIIET